MTIGHLHQPRLRRYRQNPAGVATFCLVVAIVALAVWHGVQTGQLSWAMPIFVCVLIPSIMFHEVSHGVVAYWCGDDTAKRAGRLSLDPRRHIDPVGSIIVPIGLVLLGGPGFGWAKPVPVSINRLRHPRNQTVLVSLAGPVSNYLVAAGAGIALHFLGTGHAHAAAIEYSVLTVQANVGSGLVYWLGIVIGFLGLANVFIGTFNLLPIPPLDGAALIERFIPVSALPAYYRIRMGFIVVLFVIVILERHFIGEVYLHLADWYLDLFMPHLFSV